MEKAQHGLDFFDSLRGKPFFQEKEGFPPDPHPKKAALLRIYLFPAYTASCFAACFRVSLCGAAAKKMTPSQESRFAQDLFLSCVYRLLPCRMFLSSIKRCSREKRRLFLLLSRI